MYTSEMYLYSFLSRFVYSVFTPKRCPFLIAITTDIHFFAQGTEATVIWVRLQVVVVRFLIRITLFFSEHLLFPLTEQPLIAQCFEIINKKEDRRKLLLESLRFM